MSIMAPESKLKRLDCIWLKGISMVLCACFFLFEKLSWNLLYYWMECVDTKTCDYINIRCESHMYRSKWENSIRMREPMKKQKVKKKKTVQLLNGVSWNCVVGSICHTRTCGIYNFGQRELSVEKHFSKRKKKSIDSFVLHASVAQWISLLLLDFQLFSLEFERLIVANLFIHAWVHSLSI